MKNSQNDVRKTLDELAEQRRHGQITRTAVDHVVAAFQRLTLNEAERQLSITDTNDVRQRSSYSKNHRYYSRPTSKSVESRKRRVQKLLEHTHESAE